VAAEQAAAEPAALVAAFLLAEPAEAAERPEAAVASAAVFQPAEPAGAAPQEGAVAVAALPLGAPAAVAAPTPQPPPASAWRSWIGVVLSSSANR